jgi:hypothetical protein
LNEKPQYVAYLLALIQAGSNSVAGALKLGINVRDEARTVGEAEDSVASRGEEALRQEGWRRGTEDARYVFILVLKIG